MTERKEVWKYQMLPIKALKAEKDLQRPFDAAHAQTIIAEFEEGLVNPILVSARQDEHGSYRYVPINGQHTLAILKVKGIQNVMCRVGYGLTEDREKILFAKVDMYFKRRGKAQQIVYEINSGEGKGHTINEVLKAHGYDYKMVNCLASLSDMFSKDGEVILDKGLSKYTELFGDGIELHSNVFGGLVQYVKEVPNPDIQKLRRGLSAFAGRMATPKEVAAIVKARSGICSYNSVKKYFTELTKPSKRK